MTKQVKHERTSSRGRRFRAGSRTDELQLGEGFTFQTRIRQVPRTKLPNGTYAGGAKVTETFVMYKNQDIGRILHADYNRFVANLEGEYTGFRIFKTRNGAIKHLESRFKVKLENQERTRRIFSMQDY